MWLFILPSAPPVPSGPPKQIYDSSDFMDAICTQSLSAPRRKRKGSVQGSSPGKKGAEPTSPTHKVVLMECFLFIWGSSDSGCEIKR